MFICTEADFFSVIFRVVSLELAPSTGFWKKNICSKLVKMQQQKPMKGKRCQFSYCS